MAASKKTRQVNPDKLVQEIVQGMEEMLSSTEPVKKIRESHVATVFLGVLGLSFFFRRDGELARKCKPTFVYRTRSHFNAHKRDSFLQAY